MTYRLYTYTEVDDGDMCVWKCNCFYIIYLSIYNLDFLLNSYTTSIYGNIKCYISKYYVLIIILHSVLLCPYAFNVTQMLNTLEYLIYFNE